MSLRSAALVVVDYQEDFCPPKGSLAVEGGREIAPVINELLSLPFALKIATKDWHPPDHISFAINHPPPNNKPFESEIDIPNPLNPSETFRTRLWPIHCVQGTHGAELIPELDVDRLDKIIEKGQDKRVEMYSAFADAYLSPPISQSGLAETLREASITDVVVVGLAMDYCVKHTALHSAKEGFATFVVAEGTKAVNSDDWDDVVQELSRAGVSMVQLAEVQPLMETFGKAST